MTPSAVAALAAGPDWWYESWSLSDWIGTLFSQPIEVHTFELGALIGVLLAVLIIRRWQRMALLTTLVVVLFTFGTLETVFACSEAYGACRHVQLKPWYFLGGFLFTFLLSLGVFGVVLGDRPAAKESARRVENPLAAVVVVSLVGAALYSFVVPEPVQPVTGLATVGGLVGSILGLAAYDWAVHAGGPQPRFEHALGRVLRGEVEDTGLVVGYGTAFGFGFPRVFWELGVLVGRGDFLFGTLVWAEGALLSVVVYVFGLFALGAVTIRRSLRYQSDRGMDGGLFAAVVLGYVTYGASLFLATGFAKRLWYHAIPSARGAAWFGAFLP